MMANTRFCRLDTVQPETTWTLRQGLKNLPARTECSVWGTRRSASTRIEALSRPCGSMLEAEMGRIGCLNTLKAGKRAVQGLRAGVGGIGDKADGTVAGIATATAMTANTRFCRHATAQPEAMWTSRTGSKNSLARTEHSVWGTRRSASTRIEGLSRLCGSTREAEMGRIGCLNTPKAAPLMVHCLRAGVTAIGDAADGMVAGAITTTCVSVAVTTMLR